MSAISWRERFPTFTWNFLHKTHYVGLNEDVLWKIILHTKNNLSFCLFLRFLSYFWCHIQIDIFLKNLSKRQFLSINTCIHRVLVRSQTVLYNIRFMIQLTVHVNITHLTKKDMLKQIKHNNYIILIIIFRENGK